MGFSFNKLNRIALFAWLFIASLNYTVYANQQISVNPWFSDDSIPSNLDLVGQFNDDYLGNIAYRGARWQINHTKLNEIFSAKVNKDTEVIKIFIPTPDGTLQLFNLTSITVMAPKLALKYPQLRSFHGMQADKKSNSGRFDYSPDGFSGMFQYNGEWVLLTTNKKSDQSEYISYYAKDESRDKTAGISGNDLLNSVADYTQTLSTKSDNAVAQRAIGEQIRTFRLAVSASAEYTNANGGEASAMAEIVRLVNRVNQVFLVDLAIQFELVDDNDRLIFSNSSTDPFTNSNAIEDIEANQDIIDNLIGPSNYDLGHLLNTSPGGVATLNSVCDGSVKAKAKSGSNQPTGESFHIQLVIHEFAHQLGATHTFNALDQNICNDSERWNGSSVEPGSGSTIMSYAGLCGEQNLQQDNDGYFHAFSINQIQSYLASRSCGSSQLSGNTIPLISDSAIQHTIPASTPFLLSAEVSDNDQDPLTYAWDQINPGRISGATATRQARETDNGANPLFRSFRPISTPVRYFPSLTDVINGVDSNGEVLPTEARQLNFELVVRDGRGGVNTIQAKVNIEPTGEAFSVSQPQASTNNSPVRWTEGQLQEVQWTTADSELSPISCANVDILLDADGNNTFETILESTTPNDGTHQVLSPNTTSTSARVMVKCSDNIFYAVNPGQFELLQGSAPVAPLIIGQLSKNSPEDSSFTISFSDISVDDPDTNYPDGFSLRLEQGSNYSFTDNLVTPETNFNGDLSINVSVNDGISDSNIFAFIARITPVNDAPVATADSITVEQDSSATSIDVLSNDLDPDHDILTITKTSYSGTGQVAIANNKVTYLPAIGFFGTESITYTIEDPSFATSTATLTITVTASPITPNPVAPLIIGQMNKMSPEDSSFTILFSDLSVNDPDTTYPGSFTLQIMQGSNYSFTDNTVTPETNFNGDLTVNVSVNDGISNSNIFAFIAQITPVNDDPTAIADNATVDQDSSATIIDVVSNDLDPDDDALTITEISYSGTGQVNILNNSVSYTPATGFSGTETTTYTIEDPSFSSSATTLTITVKPKSDTPLSPSSSNSGGGSIGHLLLLLALGFFVNMTLACKANSSSYPQDLSLPAAKKDAKLAADKLDFRVIGFVKKLISLPGIDQAN